jgi:hypothetical protein
VEVRATADLLTVKQTCLSHGAARSQRTLYGYRKLLILQHYFDRINVNTK